MIMYALITAITLLLIGGPEVFVSGSKDLHISERIKTRISKVTTEKDESKALLEHADAIESIARKEIKVLRKHLKAWVKEDNDHSVGRGAFRAALDDSDSVRKEAQQQFLDEFFELKSKMTPEQWEVMFREDEEE